MIKCKTVFHLIIYLSFICTQQTTSKERKVEILTITISLWQKHNFFPISLAESIKNVEDNQVWQA